MRTLVIVMVFQCLLLPVFCDNENALKCALDKGPCSPEELEIKNGLEVLLYDHCAKCSQQIIKMIESFLKYLVGKPEFDEFIKLYELDDEEVKHLEDVAKNGHKLRV
ncbi:unnamed protein product [Brassicogethes aeneus]|uniref:Uncharacterized protein n=1 Tax=Brassicogethes aeneus TaxID=1431903 RepID=A0A9P0BAK6_BRAAE|nr:unnamed protein product [Brassicogethes aeneus]